MAGTGGLMNEYKPSPGNLIAMLSEFIYTDLRALKAEERYPQAAVDASEAKISFLRLRVQRLCAMRAEFEDLMADQPDPGF